MGNIGSGTGSGYPSSLDYQSTPEINRPSAGMTKSRAQVPNDLAAAVIAVETELGTDPAGSTADVKTFLQVEHELDGTHKDNLINALTSTTATTSTNLSMNGEANSTTTLDVGNVTSGDRILVTCCCNLVQSSGASETDLYIKKSVGSTATIVFQNNLVELGQSVKIDNSVRGASKAYLSVTGVIQVTGNGSLVISHTISSTGTAPTVSNDQTYAFFLKKA
jgi:hypothetical protein